MAVRRAGYPADNGIFYILSDQLGSTSVILAQDGTVVKQDYYYPYGGNRGTPYSEVTTRRFTGQYHEAGLPGGEGLSFYNARWYDPQLGRFISADSIVPAQFNPQDLNRYIYGRANPVRYTDPSGHNPMWCNDPYDGGGGPECAPLVKFSTALTAKEESWNFREKSRVWLAAARIDFAFMRLGSSFLKVYGGSVTFRKTGQSCAEATGATACYAQVQFSRLVHVYTDIYDEGGNSKIPRQSTGARWAVHELGHAFESRINGKVGTWGYVRSQLPDNVLNRDGFAGGFPGWQQSRVISRGEIFADMFVGWSYGQWDTGEYLSEGRAKANFMTTNMSIWIDIAAGP